MSESEIEIPNPFTPEGAADLAEIQQKIFYYGWCIDHRHFDALDALFTSDALIHYDVPGGTKLPWPEMKAWLPESLKIFRLTQHNMSNPMVDLAGEHARSRTYGHLIHFQERNDGAITVMRHHAIYHDEWNRSSRGWCIAQRRLAHLHMDGDFHPAEEVRLFETPEPI
jgi:hypothetical protein